jgi:hypothetical protein
MFLYNHVKFYDSTEFRLQDRKLITIKLIVHVETHKLTSKCTILELFIWLIMNFIFYRTC